MIHQDIVELIADDIKYDSNLEVQDKADVAELDMTPELLPKLITYQNFISFMLFLNDLFQKAEAAGL